jgi:hypothetical protein
MKRIDQNLLEIHRRIPVIRTKADEILKGSLASLEADIVNNSLPVKH